MNRDMPRMTVTAVCEVCAERITISVEQDPGTDFPVREKLLTWRCPRPKCREDEGSGICERIHPWVSQLEEISMGTKS